MEIWSNKTSSKVPLFSVKHPHMVKGGRLRGIGCSPPYINPNRYTRYVLTDFRDLITVKITHKYALRGIVSITSLCARQTRALCIHTLLLIVPMPPTINRTNFSSLVSTALFPESNRRRCFVFARWIHHEGYYLSFYTNDTLFTWCG